MSDRPPRPSGEPAVYPPAPAVQERAFVASMADYEAMYRRSVEDGDAFWAEHAGRIDWITPFETVQDWSFEPGDVHIRWYEGGTLNACYNAVDRHVEAGRGGRTAFLFEPDEPGDGGRAITYSEVHAEVQRIANVMKDLGVARGDRVTIYLPMIPEAAYTMLACARIGAIFSVVFAGFSPDSLASRINDCESDFVVTADEGKRAGRRVALKANVDAALKQCPGVRHVLVVRHTGGAVQWADGRDVWLHEAGGEGACPCEAMGAEDPLFVLYTSGSTGKPKGVVHTTGGYCVWTSLTHELVFDYHPPEDGGRGDVFWCTADVGWITGHSYIVFGPMINGATQVFFEGTPTYPDAGRFWEVVERHGVTQFYTAPTAIRALMAKGDEPVTRSDRSSLRVLGTVGEPINPEAWRWYHEVVGEGRCSVVDTWWQTETGGHMLTPLPGATPEKPGSATRPFFGVAPAVLNPDGDVLEGEAEGLLVLTRSWPGQARTVYRNHDRFVKTYFTAFPGTYFTGDGCRRDADGDYWITGRVDDVINVSGHRMGTAEVESALVLHEAVAEAAVVGVPHAIKGQGIYVYVTLVDDAEPTDALRDALRQHVRATIGPIATPDFVQFAPGLPKTRSGKIMRRILRKIGEDAPDQLGDTSTLADPEVVASLVQNRRNRPEDDGGVVL